MKQVPLGQIMTLRKGKKSLVVTDQPTNGARPYIQIDEVRGTKPVKFACDPAGVEVEPSDLCIVWDGANAGTVGYGLSGVIGSTVARIRLGAPDRWAPAFVGRLLQSKFPELNEAAQARGATIPHVDKGKLGAIRIPALTLPQQRRVTAFLDIADSIKRKREDALDDADEFVKSCYVHLVGYKNPGFQNWTVHRIEELAAPHKGSIRTGPFGSDLRHNEFVEEGIAVLGIDNAVRNTFAWDERRFITPEKYEQLRRYRVFPRDVIITIMGTTGRSAVVPDDIPEAITTKHLATITCDQSKVVPEFLSFAIHSDPLVIRQIERANKGAIMEGLNLGIIKSLEINLPPYDLQRKFAEIIQKTTWVKDRVSSPEYSGEALFSALSQRAFRGEL